MRAGLGRALLGQGHRGGVATVLPLAEHRGAERAGDGRDLVIACDHPDGIELGGHRGAQHVVQHRPGERSALLGPQGPGQPLLGVDEILHGHRAHDHAQAPSSTTRASATSRA